MWHGMAVDMKTKQLRVLYPEILGGIVLANPGFASPSESSFYASGFESSALSSEFSLGSSHRVSSESTDRSQEETTRDNIITKSELRVGHVRHIFLGDLGARRGPITAFASLEILQTLIGSEDLDEMLQFFLGQIMIRSGANYAERSLNIRSQ
jgi:hypothetical protein